MLKKTLVIVSISISCLMHLQVVLCGNWFTHSKLPTHVPSAHFEYDDGLFDVGLSSVTVNEPSDEPQTYGVIVDCGSSGSRVHIYQWDTNLNYPQLLHDIAPTRDPKTNEILSKKFTPGLSSYADKSSSVREYIKQIADYISSHIPADRQRFTVIYVLATAGMRLLDEDTQDVMMLQVKDYILLHYNFFDVKTSVISGSDEGMYQWISINAKAKRFLSPSTNVQTSTFGVIEMGGASVQVAYQLRNGVRTSISNSLAPEARKVFLEHLVEPLISRHDDPKNTYKLHSTTFLGFGSNAAREAYLDLLIKKRYTKSYMNQFLDWPAKLFRRFFGSMPQTMETNKMSEAELDMLSIDDPCLPRGFSTKFSKPQRMLKDSMQKIGFIIEDNEPTFELMVRGTGNYNKCEQSVVELLWFAKEEKLNCKPEEIASNKCTMSLIGEDFIPFRSMDVLATGDIFHTTNIMLNMAGRYKHDPIAKKTRSICNSSHDKLKRDYPNLPNERLLSQCFKAVWVDTLLIKGFRLPLKTPLLKTIGAIHGDSPEWTLGAVLDKSLAIEEATERRGADVIESDEEVEIKVNGED